MRLTHKIRLISRNVAVCAVCRLALMHNGFAWIASGAGPCVDGGTDAFAICGALATCMSGDTNAILFTAAWANMSCPNQPVANLASSPGAIYGGSQVTANASGAGLAWGRTPGVLVSWLATCDGGLGVQAQSVDPDGGGYNACDYCSYNPYDWQCRYGNGQCWIL